jgi:CBS domain-containing protein
MRTLSRQRARLIPDVIKKQAFLSLRRDHTIRSAIDAMAENAIGAVLIVDANERLEAILTQRDVTLHVVLHAMDIETTRLHGVAVPLPRAVSPDSTPREALRLMLQGQYTHLPVVDGGRVVGIVSMRDLYAFFLRSTDDDLLEVADLLLRGKDGSRFHR